jgi:hypothetical protein
MTMEKDDVLIGDAKSGLKKAEQHLIVKWGRRDCQRRIQVGCGALTLKEGRGKVAKDIVQGK